jgi:hypothetical protein
MSVVTTEELAAVWNSSSLGNRNYITARHCFMLICNFGIQLIDIKHFDNKLMIDMFSWGVLGCDVIIWGSAKLTGYRGGEGREG